jgi:hypothetical protein
MGRIARSPYPDHRRRLSHATSRTAKDGADGAHPHDLERRSEAKD